MYRKPLTRKLAQLKLLEPEPRDPKMIANKVDITSIDPLNFALTATSLKAKLWWWFVTIVAVVALLAFMACFIQTYHKKQTSAITKVSVSMSAFFYPV